MQMTPMKSIYSVANTIRSVMTKEATDFAKSANHVALQNQMKKVLANGYVFYYKAHAFHWNIEGGNFPQYHEFLEKIYTTVYEKLDATAEQIRAIGGYAPGSLTGLIRVSSVKESEVMTLVPESMFNELSVDNDLLIADMVTAYKLAEKAEELGLSNYLQDRINDHKKLGWMIASTIKGE